MDSFLTAYGTNTDLKSFIHGNVSDIQSQISKENAIGIGGNLAINGNAGGGGATAVFRHQTSPDSSLEFMASAGLRSLVGMQTSRYNLFSAQSFIAVGWQKKDEKGSAAGEIKLGTSSFGASAHYTHRFSTKSHGRIAGKVASNALEFEVGG